MHREFYGDFDPRSPGTHARRLGPTLGIPYLERRDNFYLELLAIMPVEDIMAIAPGLPSPSPD
ncbi:hypothetical protein NG791_00510 [Laspinema sp. D1]|uniref:hypothetical protein n=1 Tax=Laspinema palackyanum TaxID=3231601 RepID=UPI0034834E45|nr:hypothetical protein [Laspinema sp. D2b]